MTRATCAGQTGTRGAMQGMHASHAHAGADTTMRKKRRRGKQPPVLWIGQPLFGAGTAGVLKQLVMRPRQVRKPILNSVSSSHIPPGHTQRHTPGHTQHHTPRHTQCYTPGHTQCHICPFPCASPPGLLMPSLPSYHPSTHQLSG